jgi:glycosyltransferase involved in cell wall biosynthesis
MRIHGLTVAVDYADLLALTLPRWLPGLASLTVVTSTADHVNVMNVCNPPTRVHVTEAFYEPAGVTFNKARAMNEAIDAMPWEDWILFFDADILPPEGWAETVAGANPTPGVLYGSARYIAPTPADVARGDLMRYGDSEIAGYFMLFHATDPRVQRRPLLAEWSHAGGYDSDFQNLWSLRSSRENKATLPLRLIHIGEPGKNWHGRKNPEAMRAMFEERRRRGGYQHERIG